MGREKELNLACNFSLIGRFVALFRVYLLRSKWFWSGIVGMGIASYIYAWISGISADLSGNFYTILATSHDDNDELTKNIYVMAGALIFQALTQSCIKTIAGSLRVLIRNIFTTSLVEKYFQGRNYFRLRAIQSIPNPDQQLTQDIDRFATVFSEILMKILASPIFIGYYWYKVTVTVHFWGPFIILVYYLVTYLIQRSVMSPIVKHIYLQEALEGEFRVVHSSQHRCSESIALYKGEVTEDSISRTIFKRVVGNLKVVVKWEFFLYVMSYGFSYFATLLASVVVAIPLLLHSSDHLDGGFVTTSLGYLGMLCWGFTQLTLVASDMAEFGGLVSRVSILHRHLLQFEKEGTDKGLSLKPHKHSRGPGGGGVGGSAISSGVSSGGSGSEVSGERLGSVQVVDLLASSSESASEGNQEFAVSSKLLQISDLSVFTPEGEELLSGVNLTVSPQEPTLISGPSGCGKTSLMRVISGLWESYTGKVYVAPNTMYISQEAYLPQSTLHQLVTYPTLHPEVTGYVSLARMEQLFSVVGLVDLLKREDIYTRQDWGFLSPGQRQRIAMARVLYHGPSLAIVDEISSAVDIATEKSFYNECRKRSITLLSIGHRPSLVSYHSRVFDVEDGRLVERKRLK